MNKKTLIFPILCMIVTATLSASSFAQQHSQRGLGATFISRTYHSVPAVPPLARGDYENTPPHFSLKQFVPAIGDQGTQGSCVGWATAYAARTILAAKSVAVDGNISENFKAFSPSFVYNTIKHGDCNSGSLISNALELLTDRGVTTLEDFPYNKNSCSLIPTIHHFSLAGSNRIKTFARLWGDQGSNRHIAARRALASGNPVVMGMWVFESFTNFTGEAAYRPNADEQEALSHITSNFIPQSILGGHAVTIIGYDDEREGGAFEIVNSWGTEWGNEGFVWLRYEEFNKLATEGYEMIPFSSKDDAGKTDLKARINVVDLFGKKLPASLNGNEYELNQPLASGTRFRVETRAETDGYFYVIGGDTTGNYAALFPRQNNVSPYVSNGNTLLLPGPTAAHFTRLNDVVGEDFYVILAAREPLDLHALSNDLKTRTGTVYERLSAALEGRMPPQSSISFAKDTIGFEATAEISDVVPIVLKINHIPAGPTKSDKAAPLIAIDRPSPEAFDAAAKDRSPILVKNRTFELIGNAQDESAIASLSIQGAISSRFSSRGPFKGEIKLPEGLGPHTVSIQATDVAGNVSVSEFIFELK